MKIFYTSALIVMLSLNAFSQKKIIQKLFSSDTTRHNSFLPIPVFGYSQEAGLSLGAAGIYSFYLDKKDTSIRASQFYGVAYTSTKGVTQLSAKADIWSRQNKWHYLGETKFSNIPFNFYGLGNETLRANEDLIVQKRYRFNAEVERELAKAYYPGIGLEFESLSFKDKELGGIFDTENQAPLIDKDGGSFLFLKLTQLLDTRNSNIYATKGFFGRLRYSYAPNLFGENNFTGNLITADARYFYSPIKKLTIASQFLYEGISSKKEIPFYMLRQLGNDQIMRGYYLGRYRSNNYLALQAEMRFRVVDRFGLVGFGGTGTTYGNEVTATQNLKPNYGIGARVFFDLEKGLALRVDYGWGEKPTGEKRISGLYISLGEAF
jgi:hypothetical protein